MRTEATNQNTLEQGKNAIDLIDVYQGEYRVNGVAQYDLSQAPLCRGKIILGASSDPLFPFEKKFSTFLDLLIELSARNFESLHINTCSPLLMVALPILKGMRPRLSVTLKTYPDQHLVKRVNRRIQFPRISEVQQLAELLMENEIEVNLKPIIGVP